MHRVRIFERTTVAFGIVLRAIVTCEDEPKAARFVPKPIVDAVDHVRAG